MSVRPSVGWSDSRIDGQSVGLLVFQSVVIDLPSDRPFIPLSGRTSESQTDQSTEWPAERADALTDRPTSPLLTIASELLIKRTFSMYRTGLDRTGSHQKRPVRLVKNPDAIKRISFELHSGFLSSELKWKYCNKKTASNFYEKTNVAQS